MTNRFLPSINILRDEKSDIQYIPTQNAGSIYNQIWNNYNFGVHSFTIIGSYGTGKSSFLLALEQNLNSFKKYWDKPNGKLIDKQFSFIKIVGKYESIIGSFCNILSIDEKSSSEEILNKISQLYADYEKKNVCLVIIIDEFGKFLEYAAVNNPEKELYFIQLLAEFINDSNKNSILILTLHQNFSAYAWKLKKHQKNEWEKVRGRLKEIPFIEPLEQLLCLAAKHLKGSDTLKISDSEFEHFKEKVSKARVLPFRTDIDNEILKNLFPLDILSAAILTKALQFYGQNERSLFSFLKSDEHFGLNDFNSQDRAYFSLDKVYNYLWYNFHTLLATKNNPHFSMWFSIQGALERVENSLPTVYLGLGTKLVKTIGLLNIFSPKSALINREFFLDYFKYIFKTPDDDIKEVLILLENKKIIRFLNYRESYILFEGTDIDIELELDKASSKITPTIDLIPSLKQYFNFPIYTAKAHFIEKGTPRYFYNIISQYPVTIIEDSNFDGMINFIFPEDLDENILINESKKTNAPIVFVIYKNINDIQDILFEIDKINFVKSKNSEDRVAVRELDEILNNQVYELNSNLYDQLFNERIVIWIFKGKKVNIKSKTELNKFLSSICDETYSKTPVFKNELINRLKLSSSISTARKKFWKSLVNNWTVEDLNFPRKVFPPEKTIYLSLLKDTGIHRKITSERHYVLDEPQEKSFRELWDACENFLEGTKNNKKPLIELINILKNSPYGIKDGFLTFWIPIFLFIRREEYALFESSQFIPELTESYFELIVKRPQSFFVKKFNIEGIRDELLIKYRNILSEKHTKSKLIKSNFITAIKPFLALYKSLPEYTLKSHQISDEAKNLLQAIGNSTDPEDSFFELFPHAFGYNINELNESKEKLEAYILKLRNVVLELRTNYDNLVERMESIFIKQLGLDNEEYDDYVLKIKNEYIQLSDKVIPQYLRPLYQRLTNISMGKNDWFNSLAASIYGKPLNIINDSEEDLVQKKLIERLKELENIRKVETLSTNLEQNVLKIDLTSSGSGMTSNIISLPWESDAESQKLQDRISKILTNDSKKNAIVLISILKKELQHEKD
ncbi:MAG: hypothetical protein PHV30_04385 [Candidatus Margulisbacteria bacterium]|nr:hypothetical protein [Candidatus Margulisiibacteriota bacterium]